MVLEDSRPLGRMTRLAAVRVLLHALIANINVIYSEEFDRAK